MDRIKQFLMWYDEGNRGWTYLAVAWGAAALASSVLWLLTAIRGSEIVSENIVIAFFVGLLIVSFLGALFTWIVGTIVGYKVVRAENTDQVVLEAAGVVLNDSGSKFWKKPDCNYHVVDFSGFRGGRLRLSCRHVRAFDDATLKVDLTYRLRLKRIHERLLYRAILASLIGANQNLRWRDSEQVLAEWIEKRVTMSIERRINSFVQRNKHPSRESVEGFTDSLEETLKTVIFMPESGAWLEFVGGTSKAWVPNRIEAAG